MSRLELHVGVIGFGHFFEDPCSIAHSSLLTDHLDNTYSCLAALQGAFIEHYNLLQQLSHSIQLRPILVRTAQDLASCDALIIPGGESTTIALVAQRGGLLEPLRDFVRNKPTWGTCAGMILLASEANRTKKGGQELIGGMSIRVNRNQFGSQVESFETPLVIEGLMNSSSPFPGIFIRAPILHSLLKPRHQFTVLATLTHPLLADEPDSNICALRQGHLMATSFHPELTGDTRLHRYFIEEIVNGAGEERIQMPPPAIPITKTNTRNSLNTDETVGSSSIKRTSFSSSPTSPRLIPESSSDILKKGRRLFRMRKGSASSSESSNGDDIVRSPP